MGECSRWVYYILLRIVVYIPWFDAKVYYTASHSLVGFPIPAWAFCIVRLNSKGSAKAYDWGWTRRIPTLLFIEGKTNLLSFPILGDSFGANMDRIRFRII